MRLVVPSRRPLRRRSSTKMLREIVLKGKLVMPKSLSRSERTSVTFLIRGLSLSAST